MKKVGESFTYLRRNPILYLPDLLMSALIAILLYVLYSYTGTGDIFSLVTTEAFSIDVAKGLITENMKEIIISMTTYIVVTFILGVSVIIFKFSMIREMLSGKKISLLTSWREKKGYFWPVVLLRIIVYVLSLLSFVLVLLISLLVYLLLFSINNDLAIVTAVIVGSILLVALLICIKCAFLFRYPIMFLKQTRNPFKILRESYTLLRRSPGFVMKTGLIVVLLTVIFWAAGYSIGTLLGISTKFISATALVFVISSLWSIIAMLVNITIDLWMTIFVFQQYKEKVKQ